MSSTGTVLQHSSANGTQINSPHIETHAVHPGRLVYAKPQDLPSYPSVGLAPHGAAAGAAATLGWNRRKSPDIWNPDASSASAAALLARDHKMAATWTPSPSSHGAQAAALAHNAAKNTSSTRPTPTDHGHSAANLAFKASRSALATDNARSKTLNHQRSLMAARGAMTGRPRANTAPLLRESYPDQANAAANALKAATVAHRPKRSATESRVGAVPQTTMSRQMFTSHPPVKPETDDNSREEQLHASAVLMAKRMYNQQQKLTEQTKKAHTSHPTTPRRTRSSSSLSNEEVAPMQFTTLQDAAYKLAQERLSKLHEANLRNREYQEYYGQSRPHRKFLLKGMLRMRSSSESDAFFQDRKRSQQIISQMSMFSSKLSEIDGQKRQQDRDALLAAAQRNVQARLKGMDEKISQETGMVGPSTSTNWETKAQIAAQARSDNRMSKHGKVDIGAGKFMGQEEIDAIAAQRVQPTLDEINEKAEKEHARQAELRLDAEAKREARERERAREREVTGITKKLKEQERHERKEARAEEKKEAKAKREEERAAKAEQKRLAKEAKEAKHRSAPITLLTHGRLDPEQEQSTGEERVELNNAGQPVRVPAREGTAASRPTRVEIPESGQLTRTESLSPKLSPTDKVKTWFKSRFSRGSKSEEDRPRDGSRRGFIGGHALTGLDSNNVSTSSVDNRSASVRAVALAGRRRTDLSESYSITQSPNPENVSPLSTSSEGEYFRDMTELPVQTGLRPPRPIQDSATKKSQSPSRDSRFLEMM